MALVKAILGLETKMKMYIIKIIDIGYSYGKVRILSILQKLFAIVKLVHHKQGAKNK